MKCHVYMEKVAAIRVPTGGEKGTFRWKLVTRNGKIIATSHEGYMRPGACEHAAELALDCSGRGIPIVRDF